MRINARLDKEARNNLHFLQQATQNNNTEIVKTALRHHANLVREDARHRNAVLGESGFIACFDGPQDLSANYKKTLQDLSANYKKTLQDHLDEKYPAEQDHNH